ncbi:hypothetical protein VY88_01390 [Azospirillum thiophilum]|uniref:Uncharacterized protein n=1 Tax=Azospirillum thiophilum TaxID=528244 RepID=A0AAC8VXX6_9PROT|nr:hypothetical protein [Azospirillum thiophilum]ALG71402.1 hypothetical protein AL072_11320 [Azospirillum thiophilum]KJR64948.1 hypothetical protein VY88_01390 [Azospirillum thiophilum]
MPPDCLHPAEGFAAAGPIADDFPRWAEEPPVPPDGALVPGSRFHEEQWVMAAGMLARGASFQQVARAMGCSRTTLWRAHYGSQPFRHRVWWERQALNREADLRLGSLRAMVTEQIERLVSAGDPATVRWLAERLGLFTDIGRPRMQEDSPVRPASHHGQAGSEPQPRPQPSADAADVPSPAEGRVPASSPAPAFDDDAVPGALRERTPPAPKAVAAILARPEADGPAGVYPWTLNRDDPFPNLGSAMERRGGQGAFARRGR